LNAAKPMREITSAAKARLLFLESVARGRHRLGVADPHGDWVGRLARARPWGRLGSRLAGQSPLKTAICERWDPQFPEPVGFGKW